MARVHVRVASVYDPWGRGPIAVTLKADGPAQATVTVAGDGFTDTWEWTAAKGQRDPSRIVGRTAREGTIITLEKSEPRTRQLLQAVEDEL